MKLPEKQKNHFRFYFLLLLVAFLWFFDWFFPPKERKAKKIFATDVPVIVLSDGEFLRLTTARNHQVIRIDSVLKSMQGDNPVPVRIEGVAEGFNFIAVPKGFNNTFIFSDGTEAVINADSYITYKMDSISQMSISGEAFFKFPLSINSKPTYLYTPLATVKATGGTININSYVDTLCGIGSFRGEHIVYRGEDKIPLELNKPTDMAVHASGNLYLARLDSTLTVPEWVKGYFHFTNYPLELIFSDIDRWYKVEHVFDDPELAFEPGHLHIQKNVSLKQVLVLLKRNGVGYNIVGNIIHIFKIKYDHSTERSI